MVSSARQAIAGLLLIVASISFARAQQRAPEKVPAASVSGTVTVKGKAIAGIIILAITPNSWDRERYRAVTDQLGNYSLTGLTPGRYEIQLASKSFVAETEQATKSLLLGDGETVEDVNFALLPGGVITGRVTDADSQPVIEEQVHLVSAEFGSHATHEPVQTDDRGIYRFFGVRPGKYKIGAGQQSIIGAVSMEPRPLYPQTFHPSASELEKAAIVEVKEGSESSGIDIVMIRPVTTFKISGRVVDGETGKPLPNLPFGLQRTSEHGSYSIDGAVSTNAAGEFKFEGLTPGQYSIYIMPQSNVRAEPLSLTIVDQDIKDLILKSGKGASVSGVVVLEGSEDKVLRPRSGEILVYARQDGPVQNFHSNLQLVSQDGSFKIVGLSKGKIHLDLFDAMRKPGAPRYGIARVERNGLLLTDGIELKDGEDVGGLRLVVKEFNGKIRGVVKVEKGNPVFSHVDLSLVRVEDDPMKNVATALSSNTVDSRGHFSIDGLVPGTYIVTIRAIVVGGQTQLTAEQQVTVTNNFVTEVTIKLEDKPEQF